MKYERLREAGFINSDILKLSEVKLEDAEKLLVDVLSKDLRNGHEITLTFWRRAGADCLGAKR